MFAQWASGALAKSLTSADPDLAGDKIGYDPTRIAKLEETFKRYEDHFNRHLRILMDRFVCINILDCLGSKTSNSLNYFAATESVVLLKLAHSLSSISKED